MTEGELLRLAESAVRSTGMMLRALPISERRIVGTELGGREVKLGADRRAHDHLSELLVPSGLPILSEEDDSSHNLGLGAVWVIDPLDGSYNFVRNLGHSMVACALFRAGKPVFGVLFDVLDASTYVGGPEIPSTCNGHLIRSSRASSLQDSILCTGFPARFDFAAASEGRRQLEFMAAFAKVRMLGSASYSLCLVACGAADVYAERSIMLWDVAAGLAIALGAGAQTVSPDNLTCGPISVIVSAERLTSAVNELATR